MRKPREFVTATVFTGFGPGRRVTGSMGKHPALLDMAPVTQRWPSFTVTSRSRTPVNRLNVVGPASVTVAGAPGVQATRKVSTLAGPISERLTYSACPSRAQARDEPTPPVGNGEPATGVAAPVASIA